MRNIWKTIFVGMVVPLLLLTIIPLTGADIGTLPEDRETIVIYRFGPQGRIETVPYEIGVGGTAEVSEKVMEICKELLDTDEEIKQFVETESNFNYKVESKGKGFHFAAFRPMLRILPIIRSFIFYQYVRSNNEDAYTKADNSTLAEGPHKGQIVGFIGYTGFSTRIFGQTVICGYSLFRISVKPLD